VWKVETVKNETDFRSSKRDNENANVITSYVYRHLPPPVTFVATRRRQSFTFSSSASSQLSSHILSHVSVALISATDSLLQGWAEKRIFVSAANALKR